MKLYILPFLMLSSLAANAQSILDQIANPIGVQRENEKKAAEAEALKARAARDRAEAERLRIETQRATKPVQPSVPSLALTPTEAQVAAFKLRVEAAKRKHPDFEAVVAKTNVPMTPAMLAAVTESDYGGEMAYYLATHPAEAGAIAKLEPVPAILALGRIEATLQ